MTPAVTPAVTPAARMDRCSDSPDPSVPAPTVAAMDSFSRSGLTFPVRDHGPADGPAVVLLHGLARTEASFIVMEEALRAHAVGLVVAEVAVAGDAALKWEVSRGGAAFPHLYRALRMAEVVAVRGG